MFLEIWNYILQVYEVLQESIFFNIAILLILGIIGGNIAEKLKLPRVTGYIIVGMIFGPSGLHLINKDFLYEIKLIKVLTLGFVGFNIGMELNKLTLKLKGGRVLFITFFQAFITFITVFTVVYFISAENKIVYALILGSIATVTTPAPIVACMRSYKTKGRISDLICPIVAIDDIIGIVLFSLALPFSIYLAGHEGHIESIQNLFLGPIFNIGFSIIAGFILGLIALKILKHYKNADNISIVLVIFISVLFAVGLGETFGTSDILLPLVMGMVISNGLEMDLVEKFKRNTDAIVLPLLLVFFTVSGADLSIRSLSLIGVIGTAYVLTRIIGKMLGTTLAARILKEDKVIQKYLGLTLIPQGGVALDMAILAEVRFIQIAVDTGASEYEIIGTTIFSVVLAAVIIYKIIGEIVVKRAFNKANEITAHLDEISHVI
jgi:NhaP-type Na+/H+ or K+/H+ antiporter